MTALRSFIFNTLFYANLIAFMCAGAVFYITPRRWSIRALQCWAHVSVWLLCAICGIRLEVRGRETIPTGPLLVTAKHQSLFETFALLPLFDDPAMVLKRELTWIPLFGWFALKFKMIKIDRSAGPRALRGMIREAENARDLSRQIVIFPEGTRRMPGAAPGYKPGAVALYGALDIPCLPVALNSGMFWPRRSHIRGPGTIVIEVLEPIAPGLERAAFSAELESRIETATAKLEAEARAQTGARSR